MWQTFLKVLPYLLIGGAGVVVWYVVTKGVPAAGSAVKNWWTSETKAIEARLTALEQKVGIAPATVTMPAATGAVSHTGPVGTAGAH